MTFLKDVDRDKKEVEHMTRKEFNDYLTDRGYDYPTKSKKTLNGWRYINVFGVSSYLDPKKIFALVVYSPRDHMREVFFKTPEEALSTAPNDGLWQVLNMITGEVMYDIYNTNPKAKMESKVMNLTESYLNELFGEPGKLISHSYRGFNHCLSKAGIHWSTSGAQLTCILLQIKILERNYKKVCKDQKNPEGCMKKVKDKISTLWKKADKHKQKLGGSPGWKNEQKRLLEMEIRGENKPIENPDRRPNYIGMCMNEMPNDRMKIKCLRRVRELTVMNPFYQYRIDRFIDAINDRYEPTDKPGFTEFIRGTEDRLTEAEEIEPFRNVVSDLYQKYTKQCLKKFRKGSPDFYKCLRKKYNGKN